MPKMKTRKCAAKRVKMTGTGKFRHFRAGSRHLKTGKGSSRKRRLRKSNEVRSTEMRRIRSALPYGV
ncbi:MAG TPA: 50S ribosomal protein L35 [Lentisphaeria bacterium]|nr:MAG: 50S ribosomal protein L35 [Lentisphaerae bacterium GWF2_49_21]HBC89218.1 50S ribosomal protein L35 [Lentisphaeria bacterium]